MTQDWHPLDADQGYECRQVEDGNVLVRDKNGKVTELTREEFRQLREPGDNPKGLS